MKLNLTALLILTMACYGAVHACVSFMVPAPVESLAKAGIQIEVREDDSKVGSFRFSVTIDKKLPWVAATLYNDKDQSTTLVMSELKNGNRTFSFGLRKEQITTSMINLSYGKKGEDGHYRGSLMSLDLGLIFKHVTQTKSESKNPEPESSR